MAENLNNKYFSLHRALHLLEKSNVVEVLAMKLIPVSDMVKQSRYRLRVAQRVPGS
jgi:hypothetical protein